MEEVLLKNIEKKIWNIFTDRGITQDYIDSIIAVVKEYGEFKYDAGAEAAYHDSYYSGDEA